MYINFVPPHTWERIKYIHKVTLHFQDYYKAIESTKVWTLLKIEQKSFAIY